MEKYKSMVLHSIVSEFDGDDLVGQAAAFFTGGFETSSTTMSFTLYELALNQEIQRTLRKEILDALEESGGKITYEMVSNLRVKIIDDERDYYYYYYDLITP